MLYIVATNVFESPPLRSVKKVALCLLAKHAYSIIYNYITLQFLNVNVKNS